MNGWMEDLKYAARRLARSPAFAATALVILVLGIGVNTAAFSVVNALLFQPPPFAEPERVVLVLQDSDDGNPQSTSYPAYLDVRRYEDVFEGVSASYGAQVFLEQEGTLAPLAAEYATASYLRVLGLSPSRGVWFDETADDPDGPPMAVVTHRMWTDRLGSDPDVVGSTLRIAGRTVAVVGVGPATFNGGFGPNTTDLWLSISAMGPTGGQVWSLTRREDHPFRVRARLAPGVSVPQAAAAMDGLAADLAEAYPELERGRDISVLPVLETRVTPEFDARVTPVAALVMAIVVLVLLIATLNLANLLLVRTLSRARELAVRLALGANRGRLVRVVLSEAMLLSAAGGAAALAAAAALFSMARKYRFDFGLGNSVDIRLDLRVLAFTAAVAVLAGLVFGLVPALRATSRGIGASLHEDAGIAIGARRRFGLTGMLVSVQVAASVLLLAVAGVFVESVVRAQSADPGFDWEDLAQVYVSTQPLDLDAESAPLLQARIEERLSGLPEVRRVTQASHLPANGRGTTTLLLGSALGGVDRPTEIPWTVVAPGYFDVMGIGIVAGRTFTEQDRTGPTVAIVSEAMARNYWGRSDVVGERYRSESSPDTPIEIVGVASDVPVSALGEPPSPALYWPRQGAMTFSRWVVETAGPPGQALSSVRAAIAQVDDRILLLDASTVQDHLGATLRRQRFVGTLLAGVGAFALLLAVLGLYGVVSYAVSRRRREVGIRIALGAARDSVVGLFVRDVAGVVVLGGLVGLAVAVPVADLVSGLFTGGGASASAAMGAAVLLVATALVATLVPARSAARTDPTRALRPE